MRQYRKAAQEEAPSLRAKRSNLFLKPDCFVPSLEGTVNGFLLSAGAGAPAFVPSLEGTVNGFLLSAGAGAPAFVPGRKAAWSSQ